MGTTLVRNVMTSDPVSLRSDTPIVEAAKHMQKADIGDVIVTNGDQICGIVTDRDVVVRVVAAGKDPSSTTLQEACSQDITTITPDTPIDTAVSLMRDLAIRRLPVVEEGRAVGIVSIGDLAVERDEDSALADISAASQNN
jgi:CBS domain-containing protein